MDYFRIPNLEGAEASRARHDGHGVGVGGSAGVVTVENLWCAGRRHGGEGLVGGSGERHCTGHDDSGNMYAATVASHGIDGR